MNIERVLCFPPAHQNLSSQIGERLEKKMRFFVRKENSIVTFLYIYIYIYIYIFFFFLSFYVVQNTEKYFIQHFHIYSQTR